MGRVPGPGWPDGPELPLGQPKVCALCRSALTLLSLCPHCAHTMLTVLTLYHHCAPTVQLLLPTDAVGAARPPVAALRMHVWLRGCLSRRVFAGL